MARRLTSLLPAAACLEVLVTVVVYLLVLHQQNTTPASWVVALLVLGALGAAYASVPNAPGRRSALGVCTALLGALGLLALLSIGLLVLVGAALCGAALLVDVIAAPVGGGLPHR